MPRNLSSSPTKPNSDITSRQQPTDPPHPHTPILHLRVCQPATTVGGLGGAETLTKNGSNASGGGSRRKIRPFSPARDRPQPNPICLSASAPSPFPKHLVSANIDSISNSPVQSPTVESPMTPAGSHPDFSRSNLQYYSMDDDDIDNDVNISLGVRHLQVNKKFLSELNF